MKQTYLIILLLGWFNLFSQRNTSFIFEEKQVASIDKKIDSILLIGIGSTTTRIFLDDLSQALVKCLADNDIVANYHYLGKNTAEAKSGFDTISKKGFKAILFFLPKGSSYYDVQGGSNQRTWNTGIGPITITTASARIDYQQDFNLNLCIPDANMKKIWTASLEFSGDLGKSKNAKKVATKILSFFKNNKYLR